MKFKITLWSFLNSDSFERILTFDSKKEFNNFITHDIHTILLLYDIGNFTDTQLGDWPQFIDDEVASLFIDKIFESHLKENYFRNNINSVHILNAIYNNPNPEEYIKRITTNLCHSRKKQLLFDIKNSEYIDIEILN